MKKILGIGLLVLLCSGCDSKQVTVEEVSKKESNLSFSYEGEFGSNDAYIITDKKTNVRYLYIKRFDSRGGCSIVQMKD